MNLLTLSFSILGAALLLGAAAGYFRRGEGEKTVELLRIQVQVFKDNEAEHLRQIGELKAVGLEKDKTIAEQRNTIKTMVKEFKEYKNG